MGLYFKFFAIHLKSQMQYKVSFFFTMFAQFLVSLSGFAAIYFMFLRFNVIEGFTFEQVLICFSTILTAFSIVEVFGRGVDMFPRTISNGEFDRMLSRPRNIIVQIIVSKMEFTRLGRLLQAVLVLVYAIPTSGVNWTWDNILTLVLMIVCGTIVFFALFIIYAAISFFTIEGLEFMNILTHGGREFGGYPYSIYGKGILKFLTFVIPLALVQYYPLLYILDINNSVLYMLCPLFGILLLIPAYIIFMIGLRRYKSIGS